MHIKFSDFVSEIKPLSFFKKREQSKRFEHADVFQRNVVHALLFKLWKNTKAFNQKPKAFLAKSFKQKMKTLDIRAATTPYQHVTDWTFQKPKSLFTEAGHIKSERCGPSMLLSELKGGIAEIQCISIQSPHFQSASNLFYDYLYRGKLTTPFKLGELWHNNGHRVAILAPWLKELSGFTGTKTPTKEHSLKALNFVNKNRENLRTLCKSAHIISDATLSRYLSEDRKLARSKPPPFLYFSQDEGLNRLERSALIYTVKLVLLYLIDEKLLSEFEDYKDQHKHFLERLNQYLYILRQHVAALVFLQCVKRNTQKDKNKRQGARYKKPKIDNFLPLSISKATGDLKLAMQILYLTGIRPIEFEKGVSVHVTESQICFEVRGAKLRDKTEAGSGQAWRKFAIPLDELPEGFEIWKRLPEGHAGVLCCERVKLWRHFRHFKKQNPEFRNLRPYSFRHGFASALKLAGFSPALIAQAMGHQSTRTQRKYGSAKERKSGTFMHPAQALEDVDAAAEVRVYESSLDFAALNEAGVDDAGVDADTTAENGATSEVHDGAHDNASEASNDVEASEAAKTDTSDFDPDPFGF